MNRQRPYPRICPRRLAVSALLAVFMACGDGPTEAAKEAEDEAKAELRAPEAADDSTDEGEAGEAGASEVDEGESDAADAEGSAGEAEETGQAAVLDSREEIMARFLASLMVCFRLL